MTPWFVNAPPGLNSSAREPLPQRRACESGESAAKSGFMKIGVVGCGALGSYYGARLLRAGADLHFLLRTDYETVLREGVSILSPEGDFLVRPRCARHPEEIGPCDVVLIGLKTTANHQYGALLPPLVGPGTAVVTLQNGLGNEARLAELLGDPSIVLGGLCFVCLNRIAPGVVRHLAFGKIILGEYLRPALPRTRELAAWLERAGVPCEVTDRLDQARWEKLIWNVPFNGLGVAGVAGYEALLRGVCPPPEVRGPVLDTAALLGDARWESLVLELMREVIGAARALGLNVSGHLAEYQVERTRTMGAYRASTLIDYERGQPLELESMFLEPLRQARQCGFPTPRLEALCAVLRQLDPGAASG